MFTLPTVPNISGFNAQYSLNGGAFSSSPTTSSARCHTIAARYVIAASCGTTSANTPGIGACATSNTVNVVIYPAAPAMATPLNTCNAALAPIAAVINLSAQGFTAEYAGRHLEVH